jgi:hypothetical protein
MEAAIEEQAFRLKNIDNCCVEEINDSLFLKEQEYSMLRLNLKV